MCTEAAAEPDRDLVTIEQRSDKGDVNAHRIQNQAAPLAGVIRGVIDESGTDLV
jgi:hypothetical protein